MYLERTVHGAFVRAWAVAEVIVAGIRPRNILAVGRPVVAGEELDVAVGVVAVGEVGRRAARVAVPHDEVRDDALGKRFAPLARDAQLRGLVRERVHRRPSPILRTVLAHEVQRVGHAVEAEVALEARLVEDVGRAVRAAGGGLRRGQGVLVDELVVADLGDVRRAQHARQRLVRHRELPVRGLARLRRCAVRRRDDGNVVRGAGRERLGEREDGLARIQRRTRDGLDADGGVELVCRRIEQGVRNGRFEEDARAPAACLRNGVEILWEGLHGALLHEHVELHVGERALGNGVLENPALVAGEAVVTDAGRNTGRVIRQSVNREDELVRPVVVDHERPPGLRRRLGRVVNVLIGTSAIGNAEIGS